MSCEETIENNSEKEVLSMDRSEWENNNFTHLHVHT